MTSLLKIELVKIFSKWRTYIGFIAIGVMVPLVHLGLYFEGEHIINSLTRSMQDSFVFVGNLLNGYFVGNLVLQALFVHIPFLIVLVGGDLLAGEATLGTYRMLLTRPVSRFRVITSKFIAGTVYTNLLLLFLAFMSIGLGLIIFGSGELIVMSDRLYIFAAGDILWRFLLAYAYASVAMTMVFSLSFLFSSFVENAIGPIVATMAIIIIFLVLSALPIEFLEHVKPYLFTTYLGDWRDFFADPVDYGSILKSTGVLVLHIIALYAASLTIFIKKDILS